MTGSSTTQKFHRAPLETDGWDVMSQWLVNVIAQKLCYITDKNRPMLSVIVILFPNRPMADIKEEISQWPLLYFFTEYISVRKWRSRMFNMKWQYQHIIIQLFLGLCPLSGPPSILSLWDWHPLCVWGLPWGKVRSWAQLGKLMNNNWEMSRWVPVILPALFCEWGLPAERSPIIKWGQWSQVTCLYVGAWPQWPLWPMLQWEIMHRLCRCLNSPACPEQSPSPLRGST